MENSRLIKSSEIIHHLSKLVHEEENDFIETQREINSKNLSLHQQYQVANADLEHKVQFLSHMISVGSQYVKKVQSNVVALKREQRKAMQQLDHQKTTIGNCQSTISTIQEQRDADLYRIESLEYQNRQRSTSLYTLYCIGAYLLLKRQFKSLTLLAIMYTALKKRQDLLSLIK